MIRRTPLPPRTKPLKRTPIARSTKAVKRKRAGTARRGRLMDDAYRKFIAGLPCWLCYRLTWESRIMAGMLSAWDGGGESHLQKTRTECAHVGDRGLGQKSSDRETMPLCLDHHQRGPESHHVLGKKFWTHHKLNRDAVIAELNRLYDQEQST